MVVEQSYYINISELDISFNEKFEFISVLHDISSLNYLFNKSDEAQSMHNSTMVNKNIDIIRTKALISSICIRRRRNLEVLDDIDKMYQTHIYPSIKSDAMLYIKIANSLLINADNLIKKYGNENLKRK